MFGSKLPRDNQREGMGKGRVLVERQVVEDRGRFLGAGVNEYIVPVGFLLSLSMCKRGFHDFLRVRPSSLLMLCGCISSSMASLMSHSMYPVFAARSFVSCSFISCSWLMLRSATVDLSVCASLMCLQTHKTH